MTLLPKNSTLQSHDDKLRPSSLVMYENDGTPILACILEFKKNKYLLLNQRERDLDITADRLYALESQMPMEHTTRVQKAAYLNKLTDQAKEDANKISLQEIWSLLSQEKRDFGCREIVENYYGKVNLENHLAFRYALLQDKIYFKRKKELFAPRSIETIEDLKRAEEERQRKLDLQETSYSIFEAKRKDHSVQIPEKLNSLIRLLEDIAADAPEIDANKQREAKEFLNNYSQRFNLELGSRPHERAYNFLRSVNHLSELSNLIFIKHRPPLEFNSVVIKEAQETDLATHPAMKSERLDLSHLETFTVDDISTKDMDDAISIEFLPDGFRLGVHISDVASLIEPGSALDRDAAIRATSLYLSDQTVHMLPHEISQFKLSLVQGELRPTLSYLFVTDRNYNIISKEIRPSLIRVQNRYNYEQVSDFLEHGGREWEVLHGIAANKEIDRIEHGAVKINKRDAQVTVKSGVLELQEVDEDSPGRSLISELMILANEFSASFARENKIPIVFRGQEKPNADAPQNFDHIPEGPARDFSIRVNLKKSTTTLAPCSHASLGLSAYCQVTSPIRRYIDLCNQRQIISFIQNGHCTYKQEELYKILTATDEHLNRANLVSRECKKFWLLKYLEINYLKKDLKATIIRIDGKNPLVELDVVYMTLPVKLSGSYPLGQVITMRVASVDPVFDYLKLEEVR